MPMMTLNRKHFHISTDGNSIAFVKGVPTYVPKNLVKYAISVGAEFVNEDDAAKLHPKHEKEPSLAPPIPEGDERTAKIKAAMLAMRERNSRDDFTAAGIPSLKTLNGILGFDVDMKERSDVWKMVIEELAEQE